ncbi:MAG TPA: polyphosphate kinase 1, partial [Acidimicrobiia bacterium]|nr:polyphosphate kinase 1 [Acidimicrobiia bacterium]
SWLDFNARVLALAEDPAQPLLERVKFLAIFSSNLDEFFQVRVGGVRQRLEAGIRTISPSGLDTLAVLRAIRARVDDLVTRQSNLFSKEIAPALETVGIHFVDWHDLDRADREHIAGVFEERIFPVLTPLAVDPSHPFPYVSNLSLNLAVLVRDPDNTQERFARVKVPPLLPRFIEMPDGQRFLALEQVIAAHLDQLFPGMVVLVHAPFRVTRDTDIELADESEDILAAVEDVLRQRTKFGPAVRLEVDATMSAPVREVLSRELGLDADDTYVVDCPLDLTGLWAVYDLRRPELKYESYTPQVPAGLGTGDEVDVFRTLRAGDVFVHHPYDSFAASVEVFVAQAARDPDVLAIKQALYRTSDDESAIINSLVHAAEEGKQVVALVELKARFDEQKNIERARQLEEAGVHVVYGLVGLKTHAKALLVVRREHSGIGRYCHIGTGNYNPKTATLYEDVGVLSADPVLADDLTHLFNHLTGYSRPVEYERLVVAPTALRGRLLELINEQSRPGGQITMKMNGLVDRAMIDALYDAGAAGARVDLVIRGTCCLRAGVPGLSEHVRVRSILGRYLEHSRIFRFGDDPATAEYLVGSADLMPRNLDRRVEAVLRVIEPRLRARLEEILDLVLADDVLAWELGPDDQWQPIPGEGGVDVHVRFQELALARAQTRPLDA